MSGDTPGRSPEKLKQGSCWGALRTSDRCVYETAADLAAAAAAAAVVAAAAENYQDDDDDPEATAVSVIVTAEHYF
jgi:hypothetical protein